MLKKLKNYYYEAFAATPPTKLIPFLILAAAFFAHSESAAQHIQTTERAMEGDAVHIDGNIGIGILNPLKKLHIYSLIDGTQTETSALRLQNYYELTKRGIDPPPPIVENNSIWDIENAQNNLNFKFGKDDDLQAPETLISFEKSGKIGIGTTLPEAPLHIYDPATARLRLQTQWDGGTAPGGSGGSGGSTEVLVPAAWDFRMESNQLYMDYTADDSYTPAIFQFSPDGTFTATKFTGDGSGLSNIAGAWQTNGNHLYYNDGNIGIGTESPELPLHINVETNDLSQGGDLAAIVLEGTNTEFNAYSAWKINNDGMYLTFSHKYHNSPEYAQKVIFSYWGTVFRNNFTVELENNAELKYTTNGLEILNQSGDRIFEVNPNGNLFATRVKVQQAGWSDFVFAPDYGLMPLSELENYIRTHKHLPDIPSEEDISQNGLDIGDMQNKQMQKIEELTLYVIEINKRIEALEKENEELRKEYNN